MPGLIAHLPHGLMGNRGYGLRSLIMRQSNFDPDTQLCQCNDCKHSDTHDRRGVWLWCPSRKGSLQWQRSLKSYFKSRREDELGSDTQPKHQASYDSTCSQVKQIIKREQLCPSNTHSSIATAYLCMHSLRVRPRARAYG